jgi:Zn-finger nucleic acid-binding protein
MHQKIEQKQRHCPRCKTTLTVYNFNGFDLDRCDQCEGLWLEPDEFQILSSEFNV